MPVTINKIRDHMFSVAHWIDPEQTCDNVLFGESDREIERIATGWVPCIENLEAAASEGCDLFICHEGLFYGNWAPEMDSEDTPWGKKRKKILEENNMSCLRLHDTWDNFPEFGIRDSWRFFLGLTELIDERPYYYPGGDRFTSAKSLALCRTETQSHGEFAASVSEKCSRFPCFQGVTLHGDKNARISTAATGVGCHIPSIEMIELGADVLVLTFDRAIQTKIRIPLAEMGANLIVVEHGVAEMPGMENMALYLEKTFPGIKASFFCNEPPAETVY